jgi:hypothetical protein
MDCRVKPGNDEEGGQGKPRHDCVARLRANAARKLKG